MTRSESGCNGEYPASNSRTIQSRDRSCPQCMHPGRCSSADHRVRTRPENKYRLCTRRRRCNSVAARIYNSLPSMCPRRCRGCRRCTKLRCSHARNHWPDCTNHPCRDSCHRNWAADPRRTFLRSIDRRWCMHFRPCKDWSCPRAHSRSPEHSCRLCRCCCRRSSEADPRRTCRPNNDHWWCRRLRHCMDTCYCYGGSRRSCCTYRPCRDYRRRNSKAGHRCTNHLSTRLPRCKHSRHRTDWRCWNEHSRCSACSCPSCSRCRRRNSSAVRGCSFRRSKYRSMCRRFHRCTGRCCSRACNL